MAQKTRNQLQNLFKQGAKPSGDDFSDFVESTFNIKDDGLEKPVGSDAPLKIISYGAEENLLDFYTGNSHSWRLNQNPSETAGLNFENAAGSSKLFIASSSGNVGISTTSPEAKLHILQSGNADALRIDVTENDTTPFLINKNGQVGIGITDPKDTLDVNGDIRIRGADIKDAGGTARITLTNNGSLDLKEDGGSASLTIATNGNVGIGTTNPLVELHVNGAIRGSETKGALKISTTSGYLSIGPHSTSYSHFYTDRPAYYFNKGILVDTGFIGSSNENLSLRTGTTTQMTIKKSNGNVGIGTTNPGEKLEVDGYIKTNRAIINDGGFGNNYVGFSYKDNGTQRKYALLQQEDGTTFLNAASGKPIYFRIYNTSKMTLASNGNVGIGTTTPADKLDINGDIRIRGADIKDAGGTARITLTNNGRLDLKEDGGSTSLSIATNGNVGIGTIDPGEKLHVSGGNVKISGKLYVKNNLSVPGGEEDLRMLRGIIRSNGTVFDGAGFSSRRASAGVYDITFTTIFNSAPGASVTQVYGHLSAGTAIASVAGGNTTDNAVIVHLSNNMMRVKTGNSQGGAESRVFSFIVIGPR